MSATIADVLAPGGVLRAAINLGNPILASREGAGKTPGKTPGEAVGVSVDLARELARRLGVAAQLVVVDTAAAAVAAVSANGTADVGFFAVDPARGETIAFTAPYLLIEGCYLVREDSSVHSNADADQPGRQIVVGQGSAYDLFLSRTVKHATLLRAPSSQAVVAQFLAYPPSDGLVAAGVRQQLEADTAGMPGLRLLDERFMTIAQAMGLARSRGPQAQAALHDFVETMKRTGFISAALARHQVTGAALAPPA